MASSSNPTNRRRSERVMLRMRVTVIAEDIERQRQQVEALTVRVDDTAEGDFAVAFEFDSANPKFWPVVFPPEDWVSVPA